MAWIRKIHRHMRFLECELPMPFDEDFKYRYYNAAERNALEGIIVPYHNLASALDCSKLTDAMWEKRHGKLEEYPEDLLEDKMLIKFVEPVHGQFLEGARKKIHITKNDTRSQRDAIFRTRANTCTFEGDIELVFRGPKQKPKEGRKQQPKEREQEPKEDSDDDTIDMENTIVVDHPADRVQYFVHRRKQH